MDVLAPAPSRCRHVPRWTRRIGRVGDSYFVYGYPNPTPERLLPRGSAACAPTRGSPLDGEYLQTWGGSTPATPLLSIRDANGVRFPWAALINESNKWRVRKFTKFRPLRLLRISEIVTAPKQSVHHFQQRFFSIALCGSTVEWFAHSDPATVASKADAPHPTPPRPHARAFDRAAFKL